MNQILSAVQWWTDSELNELLEVIYRLRNISYPPGQVSTELARRADSGDITPLALLSAVDLLNTADIDVHMVGMDEYLYLATEKGRVYIRPDGRMQLYMDTDRRYGGLKSSDRSSLTVPRTWVDLVWKEIGTQH